jgi:hypothetical protein
MAVPSPRSTAIDAACLITVEIVTRFSTPCRHAVRDGGPAARAQDRDDWTSGRGSRPTQNGPPGGPGTAPGSTRGLPRSELRGWGSGTPERDLAPHRMCHGRHRVRSATTIRAGPLMDPPGSAPLRSLRRLSMAPSRTRPLLWVPPAPLVERRAAEEPEQLVHRAGENVNRSALTPAVNGLPLGQQYRS